MENNITKEQILQVLSVLRTLEIKASVRGNNGFADVVIECVPDAEVFEAIYEFQINTVKEAENN
ncbi:hypothetical protein [Myxosarcina sp. GI1(2024)]